MPDPKPTGQVQVKFSTQRSSEFSRSGYGLIKSNGISNSRFGKEREMDKLKSSAERLKTSGAQMSRMLSGKMKELLQSPTPESKLVEEATSEQPNWGLNLRICAMLNAGDLSGQLVVRAIKKKISGKSPLGQRLALDLLEVCAMNCDKIFSEIASEKLLDDMLNLIDDAHADHANRMRASGMIRAWGESHDLTYLSVFRNTYQIVKTRSAALEAEDENSAFTPMGSYMDQQQLPPSENYPIPDMEFHDFDGDSIAYQSRSLSVKEKKEYLVTTRNSIDLLSAILNAKEATPTEDDLTLSMLEKCKESHQVILKIIESTSDDEAMLFEALNLNDELQQVITRYEEIQSAAKAKVKSPESSETANKILHDEAEAVEKAKRYVGEGESRLGPDAINENKTFTIQESLAYDSNKKNTG